MADDPTSTGHAQDAGNEERVSCTVRAIQSIAPSSAQKDSGLAGPNVSDERTIPFAGTGAIGA